MSATFKNAGNLMSLIKMCIVPLHTMLVLYFKDRLTSNRHALDPCICKFHASIHLDPLCILHERKTKISHAHSANDLCCHLTDETQNWSFHCFWHPVWLTIYFLADIPWMASFVHPLWDFKKLTLFILFRRRHYRWFILNDL